MAVSSGVGPHWAWLEVNGVMFPIKEGGVDQAATKQSSTFDAIIPMSYPGAQMMFATLAQNTASIIVSTRGITLPLLVGEVDSVDMDYINRSIRVCGRDASAKLHANKTSEKWQNKKPSDIVTDLAGRVGLQTNVDTSDLMAGKQTTQDYAKMSDNVSYAYIIHKLAEQDGARWWVSNTGILNYQSMNNPAGAYSIIYVPPTPESPMVCDAMRLSVRRNIQAGKSINVTVRSWHPKMKQVNEYQAKVPGSGGTQEYRHHIPNLLKDHVKKHAKSRANEVARHELTVDAELVGDPTINIAMSLMIIGTDFDQAYQMDSISHTFGGGGHRMTICARSASSGRQAQ